MLRKDEALQVMKSLKDGLGIPVRQVDASARFLEALAGIEDPETKRKTIGRVFIVALRAVETQDFMQDPLQGA